MKKDYFNFHEGLNDGVKTTLRQDNSGKVDNMFFQLHLGTLC